MWALDLSAMPRLSDTTMEAVMASLTRKQRETIELVGAGHTAKEIARKLDISPSAANKRIEGLRKIFGGCTKFEMARKYRKYNEKYLQTYDFSHPKISCDGQSSHLPEPLETLDQSSQHLASQGFEFADAAPVRIVAPWETSCEPRVVPEALDRDGSGFSRILVAVGIAIGLGVLAIVILGVAQALEVYS